MIRESAIRQGGWIYRGRRHHNIIADMVRMGHKTPIKGEQGFVTDKGVFVTREEAARIALECGQISELKFSATELFSEDLF